MVTSRDVAQHAGVSQATVSRVLNGSPRVSAATVARVQDAIAALDYHPNAAAASMKTRRTGTIGIIIDQLSNPFFVEVLESLAQVFADAGQRVLVWDPSHHEDAAIHALRDRTVDGVVIAAWQDDSPAMQAALASGRPVVMLNRRPSGTGFDSVTSENRAGGRLVAHYLAAHRPGPALFVAGRPGTSTAQDRAEGFLAGLAEAGAPPPAIVDGDYSAETAQQAVRAHIADHGVPRSVFCANDLMAFGALNALAVDGVRVPDDTWVVGFDDVAMAGWPVIGLTTVSQHSRDMARAGADMLLRRITEGGSDCEHRTFPAQLVVRTSTAGVPTQGS